jgi:hypothetical protein
MCREEFEKCRSPMSHDAQCHCAIIVEGEQVIERKGERVPTEKEHNRQRQAAVIR